MISVGGLENPAVLHYSQTTKPDGWQEWHVNVS